MPLVQLGRNKVAGLIVGAETKSYNSTGAIIWVSSDNTAHSPTTTWFANTCNYAATMEATYPLRTNNVLQFRGVFSTASANKDWNSWIIHTATQSDSGDPLNFAAQQALGTKACTQSWQFTTCVTITT